MEIDRLIEGIHHAYSGSAICFLGAGFSTLAKDSGGVLTVPSTHELTQELWALAGTPPEPGVSLSDIAEYFETVDRREDLRQHLIKRLTLCNPSESQQVILELPWRAVFTTNFDDIPERCISANSIQVVSPVKRPGFVRTELTPIYYVHGRAQDILETDRDPGIVLSETNYLDLKSKDVDLYATFINETHAASQIFFIGYSIRDAEIASRILALGDTLRQKSLVICKDGEGAVAVSRLRKYGQVCAIGVEGLASAILEVRSDASLLPSESTLTFLQAKRAVPSAREVSKADVDRLILTGEFDDSCFAAQELGVDSADIYCVGHSQKLNEVFSSIDGLINRFLVTADVGNGKTTFLKQLAALGTARGFEVYEVVTALRETFHDIDLIISSKHRVIFILDDLIRLRSVAEYIGKRLHSQAVIVCATRDSYDALGFRNAVDLLSGAVKEIHIDRLSSEQLSEWDALLERWGYWESRIELSRPERIEFLRNDCSSENRSIVISIFKSSYLTKKIESIVSFFVKRNPQHLVAFIAILIASLCQKHVRWDQIVSWLELDEDRFRRAIEQEQIFDFLSGRRDWYAFTSTQLADHIFRNFDFESSVVVGVYTTIVRETAHSSSDVRSGNDSRENLKELMKFRFLSRLFGEEASGVNSIEAVYSRLSKVPKIRLNDQFWLQYAMSCMERRDLVNAETYINTAMGIADKKGADYHDDQIVDQRIRLLLMKNSRAGHSINADELNTAMRDLARTLDGANPMLIYPMRSAPYIVELLDEKIDDLDVERTPF